MKPWLLAGLLAATNAGAQDASEHVAPDAPQTYVHDMPYSEMKDMMGMDDRARFGRVTLDELEWRGAGDGLFAWKSSAWYGGDLDKLRLESEGESARDGSHSRAELQWEHVVSRWWSVRAGLRHDDGPRSRDFASFGIAGLAPGFVELAASAYVGEHGDLALRVEADYDLLLTQRLVLRPEVELDAYEGGESNLTVGLRLRYEWRREVAPYLGASWVRRDSAREDDAELTLVAGLRLWF